jgi:site-specific DNA recombinase
MEQEKAIGYIRVSTERQDEKRQIEKIEEYCLLNGIQLLDPIIEKGISGAKEQREGVIKLLSLSNEDVDLVIISETSRLSREDNLLNLVNNIDNILKADIDVLFLTSEKRLQGGKNLDFTEIIVLLAEAKANADERKRIVRLGLMGKETKLKQGCFTGHAVPYGFMIKANPKRVGSSKEFGKSLLVADPTKVETIKLLYDLVGNKGYTTRKAAKYLNDLGIDYNGTKWDYHRVRETIYHKINMGDYHFKDRFVKIKPIISDDLFNKTIAAIKVNKHFSNKGQKNYNVLRGLFKCPCGSYFYQAIHKAKRYYFCYSKVNIEDSPCRNSGINIDLLNKIVWSTVRRYINKSEYQIQTDEAKNKVQEMIDNTNISIKKNQKVIINLNRKINSVLESSIDAIPEVKKLYNDKMVELINEKNEIQHIIEELEKKKLIYQSNRDNLEIKNELEVKTELSQQEVHEVYKKYLSRVTYISVTPYKGFIHFNFKNGVEVVYATQTMHKKVAIEIPNISWQKTSNENGIKESSFNYDTKKAVVYNLMDYADKEKGFVLLPYERQELSHEEIFKQLDLSDFRIDLTE